MMKNTIWILFDICLVILMTSCLSLSEGRDIMYSNIPSTKPPIYEASEVYTEKHTRTQDWEEYSEIFANFDSIITYHISKEMFEELLSYPAESIIDKHREIELMFYRNSEQEGFIIVGKTFAGFVELESGVGRIGYTNTLIYNSLIDFAGSKKNLEAYLLENGIKAKVEESHVIAVQYNNPAYSYLQGYSEVFPSFVWINTDNGAYFVTLSHTYDPSGIYIYKFYTADEFRESMYKIIDNL